MKNFFAKFKAYYLVAPLFVVLTAMAGSVITDQGMSWYKTLSFPSFAPPGSFIGMVWTIIFILATIAVIIYLNKNLKSKKRSVIVLLFLINALLNVAWSSLFFGHGLIGASLIEMFFLNATILILIILMWRSSRISSILLIPYFLWVSFASYLTYLIWGLNR